jgi:hypothetical protein
MDIPYDRLFHHDKNCLGASRIASEDIMKKLNTLGSRPFSRRSLLVGGVAVGSASLLAATNAKAKVKLSRESVKFSAASSNGHNCGSCQLFLAPSACTFVQGPTTATCSCWIWRSKNA